MSERDDDTDGDKPRPFGRMARGARIGHAVRMMGMAQMAQNQFLPLDGTVPMASGFTPSFPQDVVTLDFLFKMMIARDMIPGPTG